MSGFAVRRPVAAMTAAMMSSVGDVITSAVCRLPMWSEMKPMSKVECESPNTCASYGQSNTLGQ